MEWLEGALSLLLLGKDAGKRCQQLSRALHQVHICWRFDLGLASLCAVSCRYLISVSSVVYHALRPKCFVVACCTPPALCFSLLSGHVQCGSPGIQATAAECSGAQRGHTHLGFQTDLGAWYVIEFGLINSLSRRTTITDRALGVRGGWKSGAKREH